MEKVDRLARVNSLLKRVIADYLESGRAVMPTGMLVSITEVKSSVDLHNATVKFSVLGGGEKAPLEALRALNRQRVDIQDAIGGDLRFKYTPKLRFEIDTRVADADRVIRMIEEAAENDE